MKTAIILFIGFVGCALASPVEITNLELVAGVKPAPITNLDLVAGVKPAPITDLDLVAGVKPAPITNLELIENAPPQSITNLELIVPEVYVDGIPDIGIFPWDAVLDTGYDERDGTLDEGQSDERDGVLDDGSGPSWAAGVPYNHDGIHLAVMPRH